MTAPDGQARNPGRPSKLTPETAEQIAAYVEQGNYLKIAALASGVAEPTLHRWLARGADAQRRTDAGEPVDDDDEPYRAFRESVTLAQARAEATVVAAWQAAATGVDGDWRAGRDLLARSAPERWAGVTRVQMTTEETERRVDDAVSEALLALGLRPADDDDLPDETEEP